MMTRCKILFLRLGHCWTLLFSLFLWASIVGFIPDGSDEPMIIVLNDTEKSELVQVIVTQTANSAIE